jgi:pantoate--beta-alanine ligase
VTKLFNIVKPTHAYFGQKDAAQCVVIRRMVEDLDFDIKINVLDTVRESDGLAMSSRNAYLTAEERSAAPILYQSLRAAKDFFDNYQESDTIGGDLIRSTVETILKREPLVSKIEYVAIDSKSTMRPLEKVKLSEGAIISLACRVGNVRLIDNIVLKPSMT